MKPRDPDPPSPASDAGQAGEEVLPAPDTEVPADVPISPDAAPAGAPVVGYLMAAGGAFLFSSKSVIIKLAYAEGVNAETFLALRMALSLPIYLIIGWAALAERRREKQAWPSRPLVVRSVLVGILGYWLASYTDFLGLLYISAHFERLILFTYPGFVLLFGVMFFGQRVRPVMVLALGVSYAGLAIIFTSHQADGASRATALGAVLVLIASMSYAAYQLLAKPSIQAMGSRLFTCIAMSGASAVAIGHFVVAFPLADLAVSHTVLGYGVLLAIGATVLPSFLLNAALHRISAQANGVIGTLSPVATIILAVTFLGEHLGWPDVVGTILVLAGVGWFTLAERKKK